MEDQNQSLGQSDAANPPEAMPPHPPPTHVMPAPEPPPAAPAAAPQSYTAQQPYAAMPPYAPAYAAPMQQTNAWAIVSLVSSILGWLGLFGLGGIVGVVTGLIARNQIKENPVTQTGDGLALAGIILGAVNIILVCVGALCFLVVFAGLFSVPFWGGER